MCVCMCVFEGERERERPAATQIKVIIPKICSSADSFPPERNCDCVCCVKEPHQKDISPQDMAWKLSRPESPKVYVVPAHSSQTADKGGMLVKLDSFQSVWRICISTPTLPVALALPRLSLGALEEDRQDACEVR